MNTEPGQSAPPAAEREPPFKLAVPPSLGLPKSGGALQGMGEKFRSGGPTGTAGLMVPLPMSPCRGQQAPSLNLSYDSGNRQGPFGIGWAVDIPAITRRTDKGIPRYADDDESDIFVLSGEDDLLPVLDPTANWQHVPTRDGAYRVDRYRPRVEGRFARIERLTHAQTGDTHWRVISSENITSLFGLSPAARIADPQHGLRVFQWRLEASFDALGNAVFYEYKPEDLTGVPLDDTAEAPRRAIPPANVYLKRVHYGNTTPLNTRNPAYADLAALAWYFEMVFDYGEHTTDLPDEVAAWSLRKDPFSSFRSGFDIRTYRLCRRALMFHRMREKLGADARLVRAIEFGYDEAATITYLTSVRELGYAWALNGTVTTQAMPTLSLDYSRVGTLSTTVQKIDRDSLRNAPAGFAAFGYQLVDLDGEGIPGILAASATPAPALSFKRNLGAGRFGGSELLSMQPSFTAMGQGMQLLSLNSDGRMDLATLSGPSPGFFERTRDREWTPFQRFHSLPSVALEGRNVHYLDVDGDGLTDILIAEDEAFVWYPSEGRDGYGPAARVSRPLDDAHGAMVLSTDDTQVIFVADMSGDGMADLVRVRNGEVSYWPNLGYGRFGARIAMKSAPMFDRADLFDPKRVRLGDIDGTGVNDIAYLSRHGAVVYFNQAGNGWGAGIPIPLPQTASMESARIADLLGTGAACLVWSSSDPADAGAAMCYIDVLSRKKPHLLESVDNGLGATTTVVYAPSTQFYLEDKAAGHEWATRVPFVVQTVVQITVRDSITLASRQTSYRYAHGYYDGVEREFRGFARVESWDADTMSSDHGAGVPPGAIDQSGGEYILPPIHTVSWFHTGAWNGEADDLRTALAAEFYTGDHSAPALAPTTVETDLDPAALRETYRSLKGRMLRQEVYGQDGTPSASAPYTVTESRYEVRQLQPIDGQRHAVCFAFERETLNCAYERNPADPRIAHKLSLEVDPLGHVVRSATLAYSRRIPQEAEQNQTLATCTRLTFATPIDTAFDYRHGLPTESAAYELDIAATASVLPFRIVDTAMTGATTLPFDGILAAGTMRLIDHVRHQYWADDLSAALPFGSAGTRALVYDHFALAAPATLIANVFADKITAAEMTAKAGYASPDGDFWTSSGITAYDATHFFQATAFTDPFGNTANVIYDTERLFVVESHTSGNPNFDNVTTMTMDYRVLQPVMVTDPNDNRSAASYDELGQVTATALMGRAGAGEGDTLADPTTRIVYDRLAFQNSGSPASVHMFQRLQHGAANQGWFETYVYADGSGHEVMRKTMAEPDGQGNPRWIGNGRTVFDNKGNPVKRYEPYFAANPGYEPESALAAVAFGEIHRYDPLSRLFRVDYPNGTFETTAWDAWSETRSDAGDTVLGSAWYAAASALPPGDPMNRAASLAAAYTNTPAVRKLDPLARPVLAIADNGPAGKYANRLALDIQGNHTAITDPLGNTVLQQTFDAQGKALRKSSTDTGTSLTLVDCVGQPYRAWDPRGYEVDVSYDTVHRPIEIRVTPPGGASFLAERIVYGEGLAPPNFRGHIYQHFDGAGVLTNAAYDFESRVTQSTLQLASSYQSIPAWAPLAGLTDPTAFLPAATALLEPGTLQSSAAYDALNRLQTMTQPDGTVVTHTYGNGSLLASITANIQGGGTSTTIISAIAYNARRQRVAAAYGTGVATQYTYDDRTHRTVRVQTTRTADNTTLQDLNYTYDPVNNVVQIADQAQQTVYFKGGVVNGTQQFEYDAIYRIAKASGREQPGQVGYALGPYGYPDAQIGAIPGPNDLQALVNYAETYTYDSGGNLLSVSHAAGGAGWTRTQIYIAGSNRLDRVSMPGDPAGGPYSAVYQHDAAGNIVAMPNLSSMTWDHAGRLISTGLGGGGTAYFTYDASGRRIRKIIQRTNQIIERVYFGIYERYRERSGASLSTSTITLERISIRVEDGNRRFAIVDTTTVGGGVGPAAPMFRLQFPNAIHSACLETDLSGIPISYEEYYPYGGSSYRAGDVNKRYRYIGEERDTETGLYLCGKRYYAPWLARFLSPDPLGVERQSNCYVYADNQPTVLSDTDGMQPNDPDKTEVGSPYLRELARRAVHPGDYQLDPSLARLGPPPGGYQLTPPDLRTTPHDLSQYNQTYGSVDSYPSDPGLLTAPPRDARPGENLPKWLPIFLPPIIKFAQTADWKLYVPGPLADLIHKPWAGNLITFGGGFEHDLESGGHVAFGAGVHQETDIQYMQSPDSPVTVSRSNTFPFVQFTPKSYIDPYWESTGAGSQTTPAESGTKLWTDPDPSLGFFLKYTTPGKTEIGFAFGYSPANLPGVGTLPNLTPFTPGYLHAAAPYGLPTDTLLSNFAHYNAQPDWGWWIGVRLYIKTNP
ncbi:SpvB/TcaC N-terminal domain-containing protein [Paraburkholderia unamae]|uniref:SpvB/TcaC N-terminal domain-containing protein n=1 Tax=Paraburkholderia unamae TaxID=219649 RepID=A0ACC6RSL2_9BURK